MWPRRWPAAPTVCRCTACLPRTEPSACSGWPCPPATPAHDFLEPQSHKTWTTATTSPGTMSVQCFALIRAKHCTRSCAVQLRNTSQGDTPMTWQTPAFCEIRLGFEVTAYVYVR
ncbi:MAG: pyrroloquinoline quinone precursor peptide PqqA [Giesbergeria sp.]